jgi:hypothetical protein
MNDAGRPKQSGFEMYMQLSQGLLVRAVGEKKHQPRRMIFWNTYQSGKKRLKTTIYG